MKLIILPSKGKERLDELYKYQFNKLRNCSIKYLLFTDVSLNPQLKTGMGAYLLLDSSRMPDSADSVDLNSLGKQIIFKKFSDTSSTKLEIETAIWAVKSISPAVIENKAGLVLYSDSQCVCGLTDRRKKLESAGFIASGSGKLLNHAESYKEFYKLCDDLGLQVTKVTGHSPKGTHDAIHRIFSIIDRNVRQKLKDWVRDSQLQ